MTYIETDKQRPYAEAFFLRYRSLAGACLAGPQLLWVDGRTNGRKISSFYRTLSPTGATSHPKGCPSDPPTGAHTPRAFRPIWQALRLSWPSDYFNHSNLILQDFISCWLAIRAFLLVFTPIGLGLKPLWLSFPLCHYLFFSHSFLGYHWLSL